MEFEYSWNSVFAVHEYFSKSLISIHYLRKIWSSNTDHKSVYLPNCFSLYRELTGNSFDLKTTFNEVKSPEIKYLLLRALFLEDIFPVRQLSNLEIIDCEVQNSIDSLVPLKKLSNLRELYFGDNKISNLEPISELKNLQVVDLSGNSITDLKGLRNLINLKTLFLVGNQISDVSYLSNLTALEELSIAHNQIGDITCLNTLKNLKVLHLTDNRIDVENIIELGKQIRSCKIYFLLTFSEEGYLLFKEIDGQEVPFCINDDHNSHVGHCSISLLDKNFRSQKDIIDEMKKICRDIVSASNSENYIVRHIKKEHFFYESADYMKAQFDYH